MYFSGIRFSSIVFPSLHSPSFQSSGSAMSKLSRRFMSTFGVVGAGQMGSGIALVSALEGKKRTILVDASPAQLDRSQELMGKLLDRQIAKGKLEAEEKEKTLSLLSFSTRIADLESADFVVEAVTENLEVKAKIFQELDAVTPKDSVLASNTSSISITKIAAQTNRPDQVIGMHFMNPVPVMKLVEIITGIQTSQETLERTLELAKSFGKVTTRSKDVPGFIANRLLMPYINEAIFALQEGIGSVEDIDTTMKLGTNVPMGPLTLADFIGLDTCLAIMRVLQSGLGEDKYRPAPLLVQYVDAGWLGKKSGRGFYRY